jgi:hypothetical protein
VLAALAAAERRSIRVLDDGSTDRTAELAAPPPPILGSSSARAAAGRGER